MMEDTLAGFLAAYQVKQWRPGKVDCCLALAAWAIWLGHPDPARHLRETYQDEDGFRRLIEAAGSVAALVQPCASRIGAKRVQRPFCGSIGVIGSHTNIERQWGAIHDGKDWNVRLPEGFTIMTAPTIAVWSI